jgi:uncharacterized protein (UPF0332 family)
MARRIGPHESAHPKLAPSRVSCRSSSVPSPYAPPTTLTRVLKAQKRELSVWREGLYLERSSGRSLEELRSRGTADRLELAVRFRRQADRMVQIRPPLYRDAVSRYYYSMYHAMRAVVFYVEYGDDYQEHSELPKRTPKDFPTASLWQNTLKDARERRNAVDYEPYPKSDAAVRKTAEAMRLQAADLIRTSRSYLKTKGCLHL